MPGPRASNARPWAGIDAIIFTVNGHTKVVVKNERHVPRYSSLLFARGLSFTNTMEQR